MGDQQHRRHVADALRLSEELYRAVYETAPLAFVIWDREMRVLDWNRAAKKVFGWSRDEVQGRNFFDFLIPEGSRPQVQQVVASLLEGSLPSFSVNENITKDGRLLTCEWNNAILRDASGRVEAVLSLGLDITERRRAEEAVRESEAKYGALMKFAGDAILIADKLGRILEANPRADALLGFTSDDFVKMNLLECHVESERQRALSFFQRAASVRQPTSYETQLVRRDGTAIPAEVLLNVFVYLDHHVVRIVVRDISERRRAEALKDNLIRDLTHKIKTPIATAQMACDMLAESERLSDAALRKRSIELVSGGVTRLRADVDRIMEFFRIALKEPGRAPTPASVRITVEEIIREENLIAADRHLQFDIRISPEADQVAVEETDLYSLLGNLISNAVKFSREGTIAVTAEQTDRGTRIAVTDSGIGIAEDVLPRVFERFYQANAALPGVGLGLPICKEIVDRYNGSIEVRSEGLGKGTQVIVELPCGTS